MKLVDAFVSVCKYGRATREELEPWMRTVDGYHTSNSTDNTGTDYSHPDHFFADWLQDKEDPRHEIVRRDIQIRSAPGSYWLDKEDATASSMLGDRVAAGYRSTDRTFPAENLMIGRVSNTNRDKHIFRVHWTPAEHVGLPVSYVGFFHPEELKQLLTDIGRPEYFDKV